ncbi:MAG: hypothetical protein ACTSRS_23055 [Candidatus Helarchaeota archaeon]
MMRSWEKCEIATIIADHLLRADCIHKKDYDTVRRIVHIVLEEFSGNDKNQMEEIDINTWIRKYGRRIILLKNTVWGRFLYGRNRRARKVSY